MHTTLLGWIQSFLSNHEVHLKVGEATKHPWRAIGVCQGSSLFLILLLVVINDFLTTLLPLICIQVFVDDVLLWCYASRGDLGGVLG